MLKYPEKKNGLVYSAPNPLFGYNGWGSVTKDETGKMYAVFSGHRIYHVCPFGQTYFCTSDDGGLTWSVPSVINDTPLDDRDAGILYLGNGRLLVTWFVHPAERYIDDYLRRITGKENADCAVLKAGLDAFEQYRGEKKLSGSFIRLSKDYGKTWGETVKIPVSSPHGPTVLQDGSLLYVGRDMYTEELSEKVVAAYRSTDAGETWCYLSTVCPATTKVEDGNTFEWYHEPYALQLPDGKILVAIRRESWKSGETFGVDFCSSDDCGKTWTTVRRSEMVGSPPHMLLHSSGALICTVGRRCPPFGERAYVSYDNGETWPDEYVLRDDAPSGDLGYPCSVELADGSIFTLYYQLASDKPNAKPDIMYTIWHM